MTSVVDPNTMNLDMYPEFGPIWIPRYEYVTNFEKNNKNIFWEKHFFSKNFF